MNKKEALKVIEDYNLNPPKSTRYYYNDPYDDGKYCGSGWRYEYLPVDPNLIDAILERDKDCKEYISDSDYEIDEKFNQEMEKRFTALMNRAKDNAVDEYRKNNSRLYSMITENNYDKVKIIPMSLSTLSDFKEKCIKADNEIGLKNFKIYEHKDRQDIDGTMIYSSAPFGGYFFSDSTESIFNDAIRRCDYFEKRSKEYESQNYEEIKNSCECIRKHIKNLRTMIEDDYMKRINNYIAKTKNSE